MSPWPFVGRERESAHVRADLEAGRSVVLTGIWGIGRTSLARHVANEMAKDWIFVFADCERGPGDVWRDLFAAIFPRAQARRWNQVRSLKWTRFRVLNQRLEDPRRHVLVLDNIAQLSAPRLEVLRRLRERYLVVAIAEEFLPEQAKGTLCTALWARSPLRLGPLRRTATMAFFEECSRRHGFEYGAGEVQGLARATSGFPLGMAEAIAAQLRRGATLGSSSGLPAQPR